MALDEAVFFMEYVLPTSAEIKCFEARVFANWAAQTFFQCSFRVISLLNA